MLPGRGDNRETGARPVQSRCRKEQLFSTRNAATGKPGRQFYMWKAASQETCHLLVQEKVHSGSRVIDRAGPGDGRMYQISVL